MGITLIFYDRLNGGMGAFIILDPKFSLCVKFFNSCPSKIPTRIARLRFVVKDARKGFRHGRDGGGDVVVAAVVDFVVDDGVDGGGDVVVDGGLVVSTLYLRMK